MRFTDLYKPDFFEKLDTAGISVRIARTKRDLELAKMIRRTGYRMYGTIDGDEDEEPEATVFLAVDDDRKPLGTIRVIDQQKERIELSEFVDIDLMLDENEKPCAEATRLAILKNPKAILIKLLLWKAYFLYCQRFNVQTMLVSARPIYARNYNWLLMRDMGEQGVYRHRHLKGKIHRTFKMNVPGMKTLWKSARHPMYNFIYRDRHDIKMH